MSILQSSEIQSSASEQPSSPPLACVQAIATKQWSWFADAANCPDSKTGDYWRTCTIRIPETLPVKTRFFIACVVADTARDTRPSKFAEYKRIRLGNPYNLWDYIILAITNKRSGILPRSVLGLLEGQGRRPSRQDIEFALDELDRNGTHPDFSIPEELETVYGPVIDGLISTMPSGEDTPETSVVKAPIPKDTVSPCATTTSKKRKRDNASGPKGLAKVPKHAQKEISELAFDNPPKVEGEPAADCRTIVVGDTQSEADSKWREEMGERLVAVEQENKALTQKVDKLSASYGQLHTSHRRGAQLAKELIQQVYTSAKANANAAGATMDAWSDQANSMCRLASEYADVFREEEA